MSIPPGAITRLVNPPTTSYTLPSGITLSSFLPTQIPGCTLWLDAADRATMTFTSGSTTNVVTWNDKSGNGNTATTFGTANPVLTQNLINGRQAISFPNTAAPTYIFDGPISLTGASITYFVVFVTNTITTGSVSPRILSLAAASSNDWDNSIYIAAFYQNNAGFGAFRNTNGSAPISIQAATPYVFSAIATNGNVGMYQNGGTVTNITTGAGAIFNVSRYRVANQTGLPNEYFNGNIGEVIVYNTTLTTAQRQQVEGYLAWKWGLQGNLNPSNPYVTQRPNPSLTNVPYVSTILGRSLTAKFVPATFNPTSIAAIALWLDGADTSAIQTSGSSVTQWRDKSGSGNNVTPYAGPAITLSKLNNQSVINFGTGSMYTPAFTWSTSYTMIFVAFVSAGDLIFNTSTGGGTIYGDYVYTGNGTLFNLNNSSTNSIVLAGTDSLIPLGTTVISRGSWFILSIGYNSTGTVAVNYAINGTVRSTSVYSGSGGSWANPPLPLYISGNYSGGSFGTTQIAEVIHYNASITSGQRQQLEGYLAWKWGIQASLPATHPYKKFPPPP